jgi:hypothetical protein
MNIKRIFFKMGNVCGIEQKEEITAVRQACIGHIAAISIKTSDAETSKIIP